MTDNVVVVVIFITIPLPSEGESSMELQQNHVLQQLSFLHIDEDMEFALQSKMKNTQTLWEELCCRAEFWGSAVGRSALGKCCRAECFREML